MKPTFAPTSIPRTRRGFVSQLGGGFGALALSSLLHEQPSFGAEAATAKTGPPHHRPRAKQVIQLFMLGGASQCDTFDYKPELQRRGGEQVNFTVTGGTQASAGPLPKSPWT